MAAVWDLSCAETHGRISVAAVLLCDDSVEMGVALGEGEQCREGGGEVCLEERRKLGAAEIAAPSKSFRRKTGIEDRSFEISS